MPAARIGAEPVRIEMYDVVGQDSESESEFVRHIGLSSHSRPVLAPGDSLTITDMGPPLTAERDGGRIHAHGCVPLTDDERLQVSLFIDEHRREYEAQRAGPRAQYCIRPHTDLVRRPDGDRTVQLRRFSCAGFVIEAYADAGVPLLATEEVGLPSVGLDLVCAAYPDVALQLRNPLFRTRLNLAGDGPWPLVLPAYILNALRDRDRDTILARPYSPVPGDEYFPPRRQPPAPAPVQE